MSHDKLLSREVLRSILSLKESVECRPAAVKMLRPVGSRVYKTNT